MKIAFLVVKNILSGGGIEKYTAELGPRLAKRGHAVTVYSMRHYGEVPKQYNGIQVVTVPALKKAAFQKLTASASASLAAIMRGGYDIVHLHSVAAGALGFLARIRSRKTVLQMHGIEWQRSRWGELGSRALKYLEMVSLKHADALTVVSRAQHTYFRDIYNATIEYIPTATEIKPKVEAHELSSLGLQPGKYIFFASRLVHEKGAHFLIPALKNIDTDMNLVIAGDAQGEDAYKQELIRLAGADRRIIFPGFVEGRLLEELFSNAYIYVQPSLIEGLSISLLEAMSYGTCCLVSDIPENLEAIGGCGYSFAKADIGDLSSKLHELLNNQTAVSSLQTAAVERIRQHYSWDAVTDKIEHLYQSILSR